VLQGVAVWRSVVQCVAGAVWCSVAQCDAVRRMQVVGALDAFSGIVLYRVAKTHRMPYLCKSFSVKQPDIQWLFCKKRPATEGIVCVFATLYVDNVLTGCSGLQCVTVYSHPSSMNSILHLSLS